MRHRVLTAMTICSLLCVLAHPQASAEPLPTSLRRPVDAQWMVPGRILVTANSRSGTLSLIDLASFLTIHEETVGGSPVQLLPLAKGEFLLLDQQESLLKSIQIEPQTWRVTTRFSVRTGRAPQSVVSLAPRVFSVTSVWDHTLERWTLLDTEAATHETRSQLTLPFAPRCQLLLPGGQKLVVTDNFAGQIAIIDVPNWRVESVRMLNAHNIRGLEISPDQKSVLLAHQILNQEVATSLTAVREGILLQNVVREIPIDKLLDPQAVLPVHARTHFLGRPPEGAADPSGLLTDPFGNLCVTLGGASQLAVLTSSGSERGRLQVGHRPTKIVPVPNRSEIIVVNTFSDTVTLVDTEHLRVVREISLGPMRDLTKAERGELLFFDGHLSFETWMSCHSCHTDGHTNGRLADTLGDGTTGTPKKVLTLLGGRDANPWAWNGESRELHDQIFKSLKNTMHGKPLPLTQVTDIVSYLHTLPAAPALRPATNDPSDRELWKQGNQVFQKAGCSRCHVPPLTYTSDTNYDVGIHDEAGHKTFNPPSLRGVSQRDRYFHDGRAQSLTEVLEQGHFTQRELTESEQAALLRFLLSL